MSAAATDRQANEQRQLAELIERGFRDIGDQLDRRDRELLELKEGFASLKQHVERFLTIIDGGDGRQPITERVLNLEGRATGVETRIEKLETRLDSAHIGITRGVIGVIIALLVAAITTLISNAMKGSP